MTFSCDSHFLVGHQHATNGVPCQDYATAGITEANSRFNAGSAFAALSDGCSGGGRHTGIGAGIISLSAVHCIKNMLAGKSPLDPEWIGIWRINPILQIQSYLGLQSNDLAATCISVALTPENGGFVHLEGDGVIAVKCRSGELILRSFEWLGNAPHYPIYDTNKFLREDFIAAHRGDLSAHRMILKRHVEFNGETSDTRNGETSDTRELITLEEGMKGITISFSPAELEDIELISVFSDGVGQVDGLSWIEMIKRLLAFKNTSGVFVTRRLNAEAKNLAKEGRKIQDDVSQATVLIQHGS